MTTTNAAALRQLIADVDHQEQAARNLVRYAATITPEITARIEFHAMVACDLLAADDEECTVEARYDDNLHRLEVDCTIDRTPGFRWIIPTRPYQQPR